ncbi:MAG: CmcI family methyltransferase, partial [Planctomycetaceae bacterium]
MSYDLVKQFQEECADRIAAYASDELWKSLSRDWLVRAFEQKFMYNFSWFGRPIIQLPNDMVAMQEIIWKVKPDLIIETGIAHGGSLIMSASLLAMVDYCDALERGVVLDPKRSKRKVLGIDIDIREHNRRAIEEHPLSEHIAMFEGSSTDPCMVERVRAFSEDYETVLVCLDSNHTHEHVKLELEAYADLTSVDSYCLVFDTIVEDLPADIFPDRP